MVAVPRSRDISVFLVGFEKHKVCPNLTDDSGFWLRAEAKDAASFLEGFRNSPAVFREFRIEQRVREEITNSTLRVQIVKMKKDLRRRIASFSDCGPAAEANCREGRSKKAVDRAFGTVTGAGNLFRGLVSVSLTQIRFGKLWPTPPWCFVPG